MRNSYIMYKKLKKSIFGLFFISMMLFLIACSPKEVIVDEPVTYQLIFNTDGGTSISNQTYEVGSPIDIEALIPEKIGYTFKGWSPAAPNTMPANDLTLTAEWEANVYTINFNTDGGSLIEPLN